ncbi:ABC transporter permease [Thermomonas carbonis]|uniref:Transport permease protein n=1 Tax=Thermomonas carbonis TaxID=1463158 RepID=A0A7G9SN29_9GAMM|nr:ABC transporter permease [Thermomonas carbonis]QNN69254.1 ABC transporter permease [Thermomonas carbonis]GHC05690.1 transport permease protein [Thermomonas carbonis]
MSELDDRIHEEHFGHAHLTEISASGNSLRTELRELWAYRDLLVLLIQRDVSIRYKQSAVGIGWAVIQPLITMLIFTVVFGNFAKLPSEGYPYAVFTMCALVPWAFFARALAGASGSIAGSANMVTKVYFPRLILPISKTVSGIVDFGVAFGVLVVMLLIYQVPPSIGLLWLPLFVLLALATALGIGLWLTALNVKYRDIGLLVPFLTQIWMYASPIAYSTTIIPAKWIWLYSLNPITGVVEGFRWALLGKAPPAAGPLALSCAVVVLMLVSGLWYFRRTERTFADTI